MKLEKLSMQVLCNYYYKSAVFTIEFLKILNAQFTKTVQFWSLYTNDGLIAVQFFSGFYKNISSKISNLFFTEAEKKKSDLEIGTSHAPVAWSSACGVANDYTEQLCIWKLSHNAKKN